VIWRARSRKRAEPERAPLLSVGASPHGTMTAIRYGRVGNEGAAVERKKARCSRAFADLRRVGVAFVDCAGEVVGSVLPLAFSAELRPICDPCSAHYADHREEPRATRQRLR
jgi:hypothetical protein